jgi:hypothetical protein
MSASHRRSFRIENGRLISRHAPGLSHVAFSVNHPGCLPCRAARDEPCKESGRLNGYPARAAKLYRRTRLPRTDSCRQAPCQCSVPNGGLGPLFPETRSASLPELAGIRWATWKVGSQFLSLLQLYLGVRGTSAQGPPKSRCFSRFFPRENSDGRIQLPRIGLGERLFLRTFVPFRLVSFPISQARQGSVSTRFRIPPAQPIGTAGLLTCAVSGQFGIYEFDSCRPSQPLRRSAGLPAEREDKPEIPAFREFSSVSRLPTRQI